VICGALIAVGIAAVTSAAGGAAAGTEITGGTSAQQALVQSIISGMQPTVIEKIEINDDGSDVALHYTAPPDRWNRAIWEESLVTGAFRDLSDAAAQNGTISVYNGDSNGASPPGPMTPLPSAASGDLAAAKQLFENAAAKAGLTLADLTIYQPDGLAVSATLQSDDPASFLLHDMPRFLDALGTSRGNYDGTYISLIDGSGQTVWDNSGNMRISEGSVGSRPDLAGCSPVSNWSGFPTPPCPAK